MVKTIKELLDEISQLKQQIIELQSEVIRLKNVDIWKEFPVKFSGDPVMPLEWQHLSDDTTGDSLPKPLFGSCQR